MKSLYVIAAFAAMAPALAEARDSVCQFSCDITTRHRNRTEAELNVSGTKGRCRGQVLVSSIGPDAQIFAERYYVSEYVREGRTKRVLRLGIPFATDSCRVEFSQEF